MRSRVARVCSQQKVWIQGPMTNINFVDKKFGFILESIAVGGLVFVFAVAVE